jgi:hypothetical protein
MDEENKTALTKEERTLRKVYSEERLKESFNNLPDKEIKEMVGRVEPEEDGTWTANMIWEGEIFECKTQTEAEILANLQEIKALLLKKS